MSGTIGTNVGIGKNKLGNATHLDGMIDEVRISSTARGACWIGTSHSSQKTGSALITLGSAENLNYNYRKKITIDNVIGDDCGADLTD